MRRVIVFVVPAAVVSAVALGGYRLGQMRTSRALEQSRSTETTAEPEPIDGNSKLARAIGNLEKRMAAMEVRQTFARPAEPVAPASPAPTGGPERFDPAKEEERRLERVAAIETALKTEPRDKSWASSTEGELRAAIDTAVKEGATFSAKTLKCLTSICEMVLSASSPHDFDNMSLQLGSHITGMSSIDMAPPEIGADGRATVTCRLFRQGYPRPDEGLM